MTVYIKGKIQKEKLHHAISLFNLNAAYAQVLNDDIQL